MATFSTTTATVDLLLDSMLDHHYHLKRAKEAFDKIKDIVTKNPNLLISTHLVEDRLHRKEHRNKRGVALLMAGSEHSWTQYNDTTGWAIRFVHCAALLSEYSNNILILLLLRLSMNKKGAIQFSLS